MFTGKAGRKSHRSPFVVNLPWLNRLDRDWLRDTLAEVGAAITVDNHYTALGQGTMIVAAIAEMGRGAPAIVRRMGIEDIPACGTAGEVLAAHGLDAENLARRLRAILS